MTPEIMARTQPTLLDLFIALASGMAGAYALSQKEVSAALPGVAIAAALAPPLSVVGLGLANGNMQAASGALLLFVTNLITISLAGVIIFTLLGIHPLNIAARNPRNGSDAESRDDLPGCPDHYPSGIHHERYHPKESGRSNYSACFEGI